ncbi:helix-turn-helix domain-containing protein [Martelella limonii]|uniref:helix-turn-helix domain-containing protein n=1 Tax=Martelella limonii TaxID=1647649 RepID=UPI0015803C16|nr:cupin domain-containing protein [Martelella limonii]
MNQDNLSTNVGVKLRHARLVKGMTLKELADAAGCSESLLSKIENGRSSPSLKMLQKIARGLDLTVGQMFAQADEPASPVSRAGDRMLVHTDPLRKGEHLTLERLIPFAEGHLLQGNIHHIGVGGGSEGMLQHDGEEFGYVLEGKVELLLDGKSYEMSAGDSFCFRSERPHGYRNIGSTEARVIWLNTPPSF